MQPALTFQPFIKTLLLSILAVLLISNGLVLKKLYASNDKSTSGLASFAFSSYLGTCFYTTSGQNVFVLQLPFEHAIREKTDSETGVILKLPVTIGFINFDNLDFDNLPGIPKIHDVATITFLPGIEVQYPATPNWTVSPFIDYGYASDFNNTTNTLITGIGLKNIVDFHIGKKKLRLGSRILYAREQSKNSDNDSSYSLIETGINYQMKKNNTVDNPLIFNLYYINFYYPNELVFFERAPNPIIIGIEHEFGFTLSNIPNFLFFEKPQLGLGARFSKGLNAYRIIFGAPF